MTHTNTARMLDYWETQRSGEGAPPRSSIDPNAFCDIITQTFVIGRDPSGAFPFRLAGALLGDFHRPPLPGFDFAQLWSAADRPRLQGAIEAALARHRSVIIQAYGRSLNGAQAQLEILLAPLAGPKGQVDRLLGLYQPITPLLSLQNQRIERLFLLDVSFTDGSDAVPCPLRLATVDGRRIA